MVYQSRDRNQRIILGEIIMHELIIPTEVKFSELKEHGSLSPNNYKRLAIKNPNQSKVATYLDSDTPYIKGLEPGSGAYVKKSEQAFLRNSCIDNIKFSADKEKYIYLNPNYYNDFMLQNEDVLFCTDANIGDCCLFISDGEKVIFSSGMIKLNFKGDKYKYYVMALMRDGYFREQLNAKTPKGATIRHSGDSFLECLIPDCPYEWFYGLIEKLVKNIVYTEQICNSKLRETEKMMEKEIIVKEYNFINPTIKELKGKMRLDSGIYSNTVFQWKKNVENYKYKYSSLKEFGFDLKRGPNLAKRDLGRSIQTDTYRKGYNILIYPSNISSSGYIEEVSYLGARNRIWFLTEKNILFSAEGTVGKTFIVCDDKMHFTTNFHGTIISPLSDNEPLRKSVFLGLYLNFLRSNKVFEKMSVGANGGSFAVGYWDNIIIPNVPDDFMDSLEKIYNSDAELNPVIFEESTIQSAGIYQLNNFLIKCKALLKVICNDLKINKLKTEAEYINYTK